MKKPGLFLAKLFISFAFGFLLLEIALRIIDPFDFTVKGDRIVLPANKTYAFENKVNPRLDPSILVKKNSLGFRGPEPTADFAQRFTVIAVGGSTTFCDMLTEGKTWTDLLAVRLQKDFPTIWMNNAGLTGHSTIGHLTLLKEHVLRIKPKVILFLVGVNDIGTDHAWIYDDNILKWRFDFYSARAFAQSLARNIEVLNVSVNLYRAHLAKTRNLVYFDLDLKKQPQIDVPDAVRERVIAENKKEGVPAYRSRIEELESLCRQNNITAIFITQPALYGPVVDDVTGVDLGKMEFGKDRDGALMWDRLELYNDQLRQLAKEGRIDVIDLARLMPKSYRYYSDSIHFTNAGAEKIAELLAGPLAALLKKKAVPA